MNMLYVLQSCFTTALLIFASAKDIKIREIPNYVSIGIALSSLLCFSPINLCGLLAGLMFLMIALFTSKIGGGDVKLVLALSVVLGLEKSLIMLIIAQSAMLIFYGIYYLIQKIRKKQTVKSLPFVPYITFGYLITLIF